MKSRKVITFIILLSTITASGWFSWKYGFMPNIGLESGYYAQFNRVKNTIKGLKNIEIKDEWMHQDVSLEDFGFTLIVNKKEIVKVEFSSNMSIFSSNNKEYFEKSILNLIYSNNSFKPHGFQPCSDLRCDAAQAV